MSAKRTFIGRSLSTKPHREEREARLEGWRQAPDSWPSFEARRKRGSRQDEVRIFRHEHIQKRNRRPLPRTGGSLKICDAIRGRATAPMIAACA
jgi:hypothetical protein